MHFDSLTPSEIQIIRLSRPEGGLIDGLGALYRAFAASEGHTTPHEQFMDFVVHRLDDESMLVALAEQVVAGQENRDHPEATPQVIGYALVFDVAAHPFIPDWQRAGYITQMFVHEDYQRKGVGQKLFAHTLSWLADRGVGQVMLNVHAENDLATGFWQKQGFAPYLLAGRF